MGGRVFPVPDHNQIIKAAAVGVLSQIVVLRAVGLAETADDVTHRLQCSLALGIALILHAQISHHHLLQLLVSARHPHRERRLILLGHAAGQGAWAFEMCVDCRFHLELLVILVQAYGWASARRRQGALGDLPSVQQLHGSPFNQPISRLFRCEIAPLQKP